MSAVFSFILLSVLFYYVDSCSIAIPDEGTYYISNIELLSSNSDSALLTIQLADGGGGSSITSCKVMDLTTGTVGESVDCASYSDDIKSFSTATVDPTQISITSFNDNCDGSTATISLTRNDEEITIPNLPYAESETSCSNTPGSPSISIGFEGGYQYFTVNKYQNEMTTTTFIYTGESSMAAIEFNGYNDNTYTLYPVEKSEPNNWFGTMSDGEINVYQDVNVIAIPLPCCLCYTHTLQQYSFSKVTSTSDTNPPSVSISYSVSMTSVGFSGGQIDTDAQRAISIGLGWGNIVYIYDLSDGENYQLTPDLSYDPPCDYLCHDQCDQLTCTVDGVKADCVWEEACCEGATFYDASGRDVTDLCELVEIDPCEHCENIIFPCDAKVASCPRYPNAECTVECCAAVWLLNGEDVTDECDDEEPCDYLCPDGCDELTCIVEGIEAECVWEEACCEGATFFDSVGNDVTDLCEMEDPSTTEFDPCENCDIDDPCDEKVASCEMYPNAECTVECCAAVWLLEDRDVTDECDEEPIDPCDDCVNIDDPCKLNVECPRYQDAECSVECCAAVWTNNGEDVTNECDDIDMKTTEDVFGGSSGAKSLTVFVGLIISIISIINVH